MFFYVCFTMRKECQKLTMTFLWRSMSKPQKVLHAYTEKTPFRWTQSYNDGKRHLHPLVWPPCFKDEETNTKEAKWPREVCSESPASCTTNPALWDTHVLQTCLVCDISHILSVVDSVGLLLLFFLLFINKHLIFIYITSKEYSDLFI